MRATELVSQLTHLIHEQGDKEILCDVGSVLTDLAFVGSASEENKGESAYVIYQRDELS